MHIHTQEHLPGALSLHQSVKFLRGKKGKNHFVASTGNSNTCKKERKNGLGWPDHCGNTFQLASSIVGTLYCHFHPQSSVIGISIRVYQRGRA
jgi:hypothetical protein